MTIPIVDRRFPEESVLDPEQCLICHLDDAEEEAVVFRDDDWACEITPGFEVPGWFVLRSRRHELGWEQLQPSALASFGQHARDLVTSVTEVAQAPATYFLNFGEAYPHFHCLVAARGDDVPQERRTAGILTLREDRLDRVAALSWIPAVRAAYARRTGVK